MHSHHIAVEKFHQLFADCSINFFTLFCSFSSHCLVSVRSNMSVKRVFVTCSFSTLLLLLLMLQYAATYSGLIPADPEKPGKCVYRGDSLEFGTHAGPGPCQRLTCRDDGTILVEGCGKLSFQNCNRGERKYRDKPYPECCTLVYKCKKADGSSYYIEKDASEDAIKTENSV